MNKDRVEGKAKDVAGRIQRQAGEWTGDPKKQVEGAAKQVEGKVQNEWGKAKEAVKKESANKPTSAKPPRAVRSEDSDDEAAESGGARR